MIRGVKTGEETKPGRMRLVMALAAAAAMCVVCLLSGLSTAGTFAAAAPSASPPSASPPATAARVTIAVSTPRTAAPATAAASTPKTAPRATAAAHFACSARDSAKVPCHFSTPSGNIRCVWRPKPDSVACELLASGRAYRLRPTGRAKAIRLRLARGGQRLPINQQIVFPQSLSCHDTRTTMTCNQDFGVGEFKLAPKGSHGS
jgi:hypothetical protein